ncbi:MAG: hypothetical protein IT562_14450 [Alphaproteobacteria bacterium]|nr:hypothetical protein [Alphaproteobacteria bacterium]
MKNILGLRRTEYVALERTDLSAREAWVVVAPRFAAASGALRLDSVASKPALGAPRNARSYLLKDGRIGPDTAWMFHARMPDGTRQVWASLSGRGVLTLEWERINIFEVDENGERVNPRAMPESWLDSVEIWDIARRQPSYQPALYPEVASVSLKLTEWSRHGCWVTRCYFGDARHGVDVWIVIDALSGAVRTEKVTRYSDGLPVSTSAPNLS